MNTKLLVIFVILVVVIAIVGVVSLQSLGSLSTKPNQTTTPNPTSVSTPTVNPTLTPTESSTLAPTIAPTISPTPYRYYPSPTASPTPKSIAIAVKYQTATYLVDQYGVSMPDTGKVYLLVNMTVTNNGYTEGFNTSPIYFHLNANNIQYSSDLETYSGGRWTSVTVLNSGIYSGTMVFQVPTSATSFSMTNDAYSSSTFDHYNIVWT
jgi:hypothetical protein